MWATVDAGLLKAEWSVSLGKFNLDELKAALEFCAASVKFAPNLPEFKMICDAQVKTAPTLKLERKFTALDMIQNRKRLETEAAKLGGDMDYLGWVKKTLSNPGKYPDITERLAREVAIERGL